MPYHGRKRASKRNVFGKRVHRAGVKTVAELTRVGLIESRMCPIFGPNVDIPSIASTADLKNPWKESDESRVLLKASDGGNILSSRRHFGLDKVVINKDSTTNLMDIEQPMRVGVLPRKPSGPLRLGGVEGKYIFFNHLRLTFNVRYERPNNISFDNDQKDLFAVPYLPPMKVNIMIVKQRSGDVGEQYKKSIQMKTSSGTSTEYAYGGSGASKPHTTFITGPSDFIGDCLHMDPLGQPFGVGKPYWNDQTIPTVIEDKSINGERNGSFYFNCPIQKKWFTVVKSSTFTLNPPSQPEFTHGEEDLRSKIQVHGNTGVKNRNSGKTVNFSLPIKSRALMKSLHINRAMPEGAVEREIKQSVTGATTEVFGGHITAFPNTGQFQDDDTGALLTEYMCPADIDMSEYHVIIKAYSPFEPPELNQKRLSNKTLTTSGPSGGGIQTGSNPPLPILTWGYHGMMSYSDV